MNPQMPYTGHRHNVIIVDFVSVSNASTALDRSFSAWRGLTPGDERCAHTPVGKHISGQPQQDDTA
jgi:hypothetical protein